MLRDQHDPSVRYKIVSKEIMVENLSYEDALYYIDNMKDQGVTNLEMESYFPDANRIVRDPELH